MFPGRIIANRYRVLRVLGRGGMGVVSEVETLDTAERFAIKFLRDDVESEIKPNARFLREAKLATHLRSLHACKVFGIGEWELGPYIVMELLEGRTLNYLLDRGRKLEVKKAVRIACEICDALAEAHRLGIVHRDVKTGNVFLARTSDGRVVTKMLDFGVAKIPANVVTKHGEHSLTDSSTLLGTPSYVSPEQLINSKLVDARTDVWAVGVMLYEMLAGRLPFSSPLVPKLLVMIAREEPPHLGSLAPDAPPPLVDIVHRCLSKDPLQRFDDASVLGNALLPWFDDSSDLLGQVLGTPSTCPSIKPIELLPSDPAELEPTGSKRSDSLNPHTTANLTRHGQSILSRRNVLATAVTLGVAVGAAACLLYVNAAATTERAEPAGKPPAQTIAMPPTQGHVLLLAASPSDARLSLDGEVLVSNPSSVQRRDDGKEHLLVVSHPDYATETRTLRFDVAQQLHVALRRTPAVPQPSSTLPRLSPSARQSVAAARGAKAPAHPVVDRPVNSRRIDQENPY